jgi:hypothetical protein
MAPQLFRERERDTETRETSAGRMMKDDDDQYFSGGQVSVCRGSVGFRVQGLGFRV